MNILLDEDTNDIVLIKNGAAVADVTTEIKQKLRSRLRIVQGEWFLDLENGVPYYVDAFKKGADLRVLAAALKSVIISTEGVDELQRFTMDLDNRTRVLTVTFTVKVNNEILTLSEGF